MPGGFRGRGGAAGEADVGEAHRFRFGDFRVERQRFAPAGAGSRESAFSFVDIAKALKAPASPNTAPTCRQSGKADV